jgi:putative oxidoreductase
MEMQRRDAMSTWPVLWSVALLILRITVGVILVAHGSQKLFGWFGGQGLAATMQSMVGGPFFGLLVAVGECFGGLGILVGVLSRFSAVANILIMLGAIAFVHGRNGFFLSEKGFEYNWAIIGLLLPIALLGPGPFTVVRPFVRDRLHPGVE